MGSSLPLLLFFGFLVLLVGLGSFLDALVKRAARAEQEQRARAREDRARVAAGGAPAQADVAPPGAPRPTRRVDERSEAEDLLRQLLGMAPPPRPAPAPPRPAPPRQRQAAPPAARSAAPVARPVVRQPAPPVARHAAPGSGSLASHHLDLGLADHEGFKSLDLARPAPRVAAAAPLAVLDRLPPMARAVVLADVLGPLAARTRRLHRARPV